MGDENFKEAMHHPCWEAAEQHQHEDLVRLLQPFARLLEEQLVSFEAISNSFRGYIEGHPNRNPSIAVANL